METFFIFSGFAKYVNSYNRENTIDMICVAVICLLNNLMFTCDLTVENNFKKRNTRPKKCIPLPLLNVIHTEYKLHVWIMANVSICSQISRVYRAMDFR